MATFRDTIFAMSPPRLRTPRAEKLIYALIGLPLDILAEAAEQAIKARFPETCPEDALPYLGRDRGIRRGPLEPSANYRLRLLLWIESWRGAGVGRAMLDQIAGYLTPQTCRIRIWSQIGVVYTREADGSFSIERAVGSWNWDGRTDLWARFWVILYSATGEPWSRSGTWGDGKRWGSPANRTWGSTATIDQVTTIRSIVSDWKPAAALCVNIMVAFDDAAFDPTSAVDMPDGTWGFASRNIAGTQRPARDPRCLYWDGAA